MDRTTCFETWHLERLGDPLRAQVYLNIALEDYAEDGNKEFFLLALRDVARAQGGLGSLAERTQSNRQGVYKALSEQGNPTLETLTSILKGLGFRLSLTPLAGDTGAKTDPNSPLPL
jgi:probable addiction module antidote protein